jgi:hypothetical protein
MKGMSEWLRLSFSPYYGHYTLDMKSYDSD